MPGGRLIAAADTTPDYKLYALRGTVPPKPGMLRVEAGGAAIAVEVWALPTKAFGAFVAPVPSPLSIGTVHLADGEIFIARTARADLKEGDGFGRFLEARRRAQIDEKGKRQKGGNAEPGSDGACAKPGNGGCRGARGRNGPGPDRIELHRLSSLPADLRSCRTVAYFRPAYN